MLLGKKVNRKKNKSRSKRQRTFTSSEFSLPDERNLLSTSELFRNDALKRKIVQPSAPKKNKSVKQLLTTKKRTKSKSKARLDKCQTYEMIPYKNSLNSQIVFSNEDTKREGDVEERISEHLAIKVNQQYLVDSNRQLRISIKKEYQKKVQAAIKIQKVFRGFLTRKILQKYVQFQQKFLTEKLAQHRSESVSQHSSYFAEKENIESRRKMQSEQFGVFEYSNPRENQQNYQIEQTEEESEEEMEHVVYRHHQPIYSHDEISGYLESSEEEDFDQDAFDNHIIFETNQEYIDSRKSSLHQQAPKNKLSRAGHHDTINEEPPETPTNVNAQDHDLSKTQKKQGDRMKIKMQEQEVKDQTMKLTEQTDKSHPPIHQFLENIPYDATIKDSDVCMKKKDHRQAESDSYNLNSLKEMELMKWQEIIGLVESQINKTMLNNAELCSFMKQIMDISVKNKQMLQLSSHKMESQSLHSDKSLSRLASLQKLKQIKASRQYLTHFDLENQLDSNKQTLEHAESIRPEVVKGIAAQAEPARPERKKQPIVLSDSALLYNEQEIIPKNQRADQKSNIAANPLSPVSSLDYTGQMKKFLSGNIQDEHIDEMLKLREELMKKREAEEIRKLNFHNQNKAISQQQFQSELEKISRKYSEEKVAIQKAKDDIARGYHAALKLTKETFTDAKKLGFKMAVSRSMEGFKYKAPLIFNDVIIDQMMQVTQEQGKKIKMKKEEDQQSQKIQIKIPQQGQNDSCSEDSSDLQFTEEQLKRFRRAQPYDIEFAQEIADLGKNVMISEQLLRQQLVEDNQDIDLMKTQHVFRQIYQIEEVSPVHNKNDPKVELITQKIIEWMIWELSGQLLIKPLFSERLMDKNHFCRPMPVSDKERLRFIALLQNHFPTVEMLNNKLNQRICTLPSELLKCMRIDFSDDSEDDNSYEEIGKYEFIIGQQVCNQAIQIFRHEIDAETPISTPSLTEIEELVEEYNINERVLKYVQQRQKYISNRKNHTKQLRWEVLNIEIHCMFDAWNEELIYLRSQKVGYSGIGLNELTLSVKDNNLLVKIDETLKFIDQGKKRLVNTLSLSSPAILFPLQVQQKDDELLDSDSKWIFYADQALSYGLELVYLIQEQLFTEQARELRKKMLQFN